jgi:hypothetical protein
MYVDKANGRWEGYVLDGEGGRKYVVCSWDKEVVIAFARRKGYKIIWI